MQDVQHISIEDLAAKLLEGIEQLGSGDTSKEGVHELQDVARELYERLTVLRFKAFVSKQQTDEERGAQSEVEADIKVELKADIPKPDSVSAPISESIDYEPEVPEVDKAQVDLIDSIAEVSLAEKHLNKPLSSISEGLTILEIANFTSILFKNDGTKFNETLDAVDGCNGREEAYEVFHSAITPEGHEEDIAHARVAFENRIQRLYLE